jgi:pterin-4a-carbinolamine dehydratase
MIRWVLALSEVMSCETSMKMTQLLTELRQDIPRRSPFRDLIRPIERLPIIAKEEWREIDSPTRLRKKFTFHDVTQRNQFVNEVMAYETGTGHHSTMKLTQSVVVISIKTAHVDAVTELDREYARSVDAIYQDIVYDHEAEIDKGRRNSRNR